MDIKPRIIRSFPGNIPLPFYMTYPGYMGTEQETEFLKDLEYLQQTYPAEVRRYQRRVAEVLDKLDYEGSMIYDEYPDRYSLQRLAGTIVDMLKREEPETRTGDQALQESPERWKWTENMIQILLCDEVCKRRHGGRRGFLQF